MMQDKCYDVSWESFAICNQNPQQSFENMCRWLFKDFFFDGKALFHSEPNNPGVEVLPKLHAESKKRISFQENHPLNSLFLHDILINRTISNRDALWTTYINGLYNEDERLYQLINYFDEGKELDGLSNSNTELILILFAWLLTSSNRFLRDKTSKAMIELLTAFFVPCKKIIEHLKLEQKLSDGYYFSKSGELVCFDGNLNGICDGLLIREDYLNVFLKDNDLEIFWTSIGEKQFFTSDTSQEWITWKGLYFLENKNIVGDIKQYKEKE